MKKMHVLYTNRNDTLLNLTSAELYMLPWHIGGVWLSHSLYFGEMHSSKNIHGITNWAWYAAEEYR